MAEAETGMRLPEPEPELRAWSGRALQVGGGHSPDPEGPEAASCPRRLRPGLLAARA